MPDQPPERGGESSPHGADDPSASRGRGQHRERLDEAAPTSPTVRQIRRAYTLTALGTLVPGAGLSLTRRRVVGLAMMVLTLVLLIGLTWYVVGRGAEESVLQLGSRPVLLRRLGIAGSLLVLAWMASVVFTALISAPRGLAIGQRWGLRVFTALMCVLLIAPTALSWRYVNAHTEAVDRIFVGRQSPQSSDTDAAMPNLETEDPWEEVPRVNVLLLGSDGTDTREGVRTDTMLIASIDTETGDSVLFGIPRNLERVPVPQDNPLSKRWPDGYDCGDDCLMNGVWTEAMDFAEERPQLYADDPNPGLTATREVLSAVIGQPIDYTAIINLKGFRDLVDAMGGVEIDVQERLPMGGRTTYTWDGRPMLVPGSESGYLEPGLQTLNGYQALWYARSRITTDDFSRMRRQRCVVAAMVDQVNPLKMIRRYPQIVGVAGDNVKADISQDELPAFAELTLRVQNGTIRSLPFTIENTNVGNPDFRRLRRMVTEAIEPPQPTAPDRSEQTKQPRTEEPAPPEPAGQEEDEKPSDELEEVGTVC
ncbi:MAG TPA: LCP family protein [Ornithinimicrobium sp.]|uniref:LCP family glycopolymer transferase n=1 Tax=Ornithinimicrobium sp. TaxID=1977084 RepID=UPI002B466B2C|nr:LCP family protein [Ornithinimicrobium sp.]HKJ11719.1 LCP family protein [Ornithinimicrobium sp.]